MTPPAFASLRRLSLPAILVLSSLVIALSGAEVKALFRYERAGIEAGEVWRLITGHLIHLGWSHLGLNLAGLVLVWLLVGRAFAFLTWLGVLFAAMLGTSAGLWFFAPGLSWYVGLSGMLHGMLVAGALASWGKQRGALPILAIVAAKIAWEQWVGPLPGSVQAAGGPVIVDAHLYGAVGGVLAAGAVLVWRNFTAGLTSSKPSG